MTLTVTRTAEHESLDRLCELLNALSNPTIGYQSRAPEHANSVVLKWKIFRACRVTRAVRRMESRISTELPPKSDPSDVFQSVWYRLVILCVALYLTVLWFVLGPSNLLYAVNMVLGTLGLGPAVAVPVMRHVPRQLFRVPKGERVFHCLAGVGIFGWLLDVSGWNRIVAKPIRGFSGTRSGLISLEQSLRGNVCAHGTCFAIHVLMAVFAFFTKDQWNAALCMLLPGVVVHLYPVLLQRSIMLRIQPMMNIMAEPTIAPKRRSGAQANR